MKREAFAICMALVFSATSVWAELPSGARAPARNIPTPSKKREYASVKVYSPLGFKLGLMADFDVLNAKVPYSETASTGIGWGVGLAFQLKFSEVLAITAIPQYRKIRLSRDMQDAYAAAEPYTAVSQTVQYMGGTLLVSYLTNSPLIPGSKFTTPEWWVDVGGQFLKPIGATQTYTTADGELTSPFGTSDKLLFALLGVTGRTELAKNVYGVGSIQFSYNVTATQGSSILGGKLGLGLQLTL